MDVIIHEVKSDQCLEFKDIVWNVVRLKSFSPLQFWELNADSRYWSLIKYRIANSMLSNGMVTV